MTQRSSSASPGRLSTLLTGILLILTPEGAFVLVTNANKAPEIKKKNSEVLRVLPGEKVYLACEASGKPQPSVSWEKEGTPVSLLGSRFFVNSESLRIFHVKTEDAGSYTCIAKNPLGVDLLTYTVLVMIQPESKIISPTNHTLMELTNQELVCRSRGLPIPRFEWFTNHHQRIRPVSLVSDNMTSSHRLSSVQRQVDQDMWESVLFLQPITFQDLGNFSCVALNEVGSSRETVLLDVRFAPKKVSHHVAVEKTASWQGLQLRLTCVATGNDLPDILWECQGKPLQCDTLEEWVHGPEITSTCMTPHQEAESSQIISCQAENSLGKIQLHQFNILDIGITKETRKTTNVKLQGVSENANHTVTLHMTAMGLPTNICINAGGDRQHESSVAVGSGAAHLHHNMPHRWMADSSNPGTSRVWATLEKLFTVYYSLFFQCIFDNKAILSLCFIYVHFLLSFFKTIIFV